MHVLIAPNAFAGTLTAAAAASAIAQGWRRKRPDDEIRSLAMADGGDGTLDVIEAAVAGARRRTIEVADARGHAVAAAWLRLPDGRAVIESAQACGLHRLAPDMRNPRLATTYGVGQLLAVAAAEASEIIVGVGGSGTVDGGAGMATALGHRLLRDDGNGVKVGGEYLAALERIVAAGSPLGLPVTAAVDVDAPLLGTAGAVAGFARQKGAADADLPLLEQALTNLAEIAERDLPGGPWRDLAGAGAGGGLGFGLAAFAGAGLRPGAALIASLVGLDAAVAAADVVITGEGRLDAWSLRGKAPGVVADTARSHRVRTLVIAGDASPEAARHFDDVALLGPDGLDDPVRAVAHHAAALASRAGDESPS